MATKTFLVFKDRNNLGFKLPIESEFLEQLARGIIADYDKRDRQPNDGNADIRVPLPTPKIKILGFTLSDGKPVPCDVEVSVVEEEVEEE